MAAIFACFAIMCSNNEQAQLDEILKNGQASFNKGLYGEAIKIWEDALKQNSSDQEIQLRLAKAHQHLAHFEISTNLLKQVIASNDKYIEAYLMIVQNEMFDGNFDEAKNICHKLDKMFPENYKVAILSGDINTFIGQYNEGETFYRKAIEIDENQSEAYFKIAANLLVQEKEADANNYFEHAVDSNEKASAQYWFNRAEYQALRGENDRAVAAMKRALEINPNSYFLKLKIGQLLVSYKRYDELLKIYRSLNAITSESPELQKVYVEALLNKGELEQAYNIIQKQNFSNDNEWLLLLGKCNILRGSFSSAISCFEQVLEKSKDNPNIYYMLAMAYLSADKVNLATLTLTRLLTLFPGIIEAEFALASIYYKKAEYDLSMEYLERVIKKIPENPRPYIMIGNCLRSKGQYGRAKLNFQKALALDPQSMNAKYYLALVKEKVGSPDEAIHLYQGILDKAPFMVDAGLRLSDLLIREEKIDEAIDIFSSMIKNNPGNGYLKFIMGNIYNALNKTTEAAYYYRLAIYNNPELIEAYKKLADIDSEKTQRIEIIKDAIKKVPNSTELKMLLTSFYFNDGKLDLALDLIKEIYRLDPKNNTVANNLSWLYLEKGVKLNEAYELARTAFEREPLNPSYAHTLGWALYKKGIFKQAEWHLKEAIKLVEKDTDKKSIDIKAIFSYHLALTLIETKKIKEAKDRLQFSIDSGLPSKYKDRAIEILNELKGNQLKTSKV